MTRLAGLLGGVAAALVAPRPAIGFPSDSQFAAHTTASPKQAPPRRAPSGDARPAAAAAAAAVATARLPLRGDTTEALIGLGALLSDTNPMVREAATSALQAWGRKAIVVLEPVVRGSDRASRANARAALAALRVDRLGGDR